MSIRDDTFKLCKDCYHKLYLLGVELEVLTVPIMGNCWMCDREFDGIDLNWCVKPGNMREE